MKVTKYKHIIPLGYFCSVAMELERKGLRTASYPFDWIISDSFENILKLLDNNFEEFLDEESLYQEEIPNHYYNYRTGIHFYHDFDAYTPLRKQIKSVRKKYDRRIKRLYDDVKEPSLFIRYCLNEKEVEWIENNLTSIVSQVKQYNRDNNIVFIVPQGIKYEITSALIGGGIFVRIASDSKDVVRHYFKTNPEFLRYLYKHTSLNIFQILNNLRIHYLSRIRKRYAKKVVTEQQPYRHLKQYNDIKQ